MSPSHHVIIAGPTAVGKSALAVALGQALGSDVVNADALQVYDCWRLLTARPSDDDVEAVPHRLYGHIGRDQAYSVGHWLRDVAALSPDTTPMIFVGGTGLYLSSLLSGLAAIPTIPEDIRAEGDALRARGADAFHAELAKHDPTFFARADRANAMRLQRAWEVLTATGRPLSAWQSDRQDPPLVRDATKVVLHADPDWLRARISRRFDAMMAAGAVDEVRAQQADWDPTRPASRALGAAELMASLEGKISVEEAVSKAKTATAQYAKRQRTWFRSKMNDWIWLDATEPLSRQLGKLLEK